MTQRLHLLMTIIKQFVLKGNGVVGLTFAGVQCRQECGAGYGTKGRGCVYCVYTYTHTQTYNVCGL